MSKFIIGEIKDSEDFVEIQTSHDLFWQVYDVLQNKMSASDFNTFAGIAQAMDIQDFSNLSPSVFNHAMEILKNEKQLSALSLLNALRKNPNA